MHGIYKDWLQIVQKHIHMENDNNQWMLGATWLQPWKVGQTRLDECKMKKPDKNMCKESKLWSLVSYGSKVLAANDALRHMAGKNENYWWEKVLHMESEPKPGQIVHNDKNTKISGIRQERPKKFNYIMPNSL